MEYLDIRYTHVGSTIDARCAFFQIDLSFAVNFRARKLNSITEAFVGQLRSPVVEEIDDICYPV